MLSFQGSIKWSLSWPLHWHYLLKPPIAMVIFHNQLGLHYFSKYYLVQFWLISSGTWPRAINDIGTAPYPPTKAEFVCRRRQGPDQRPQPSSRSCLSFLLLSFFPSAECTFSPPNCKCLAGLTGEMRELETISNFMCHSLSWTFRALNSTFLWSCPWSSKTLETSWVKTVWNNK